MESKKILPPTKCHKHGKHDSRCLSCASVRFFAGLKALDAAQDSVTARAALLANLLIESGLSFWETAIDMFGLTEAPKDGTDIHRAVDAAANKMKYTLKTRGFAEVFAEGTRNANKNLFAQAEKAKARIEGDGGVVKRGQIAQDAGIKQPTARGTVEVPASTEATTTEVKVANVEFATLLNELVARLTEVEKMDRDTLASVKRASATIYNTVAKEQEVRGYVKPATK